jgi:NAD(P)-dependent dehydrogenase (short-subunit alcohol dehydrogenase family)
VTPLAGKTILVTGATDGLGRAVAGELAAHGANVLVHGRDEARGRETMAEILEHAPGARLDWLRADLASLEEVRHLAVRSSATTAASTEWSATPGWAPPCPATAPA